MKKLLLAVTWIATLSLLAPSSSIAEPTHPNEVGLYLTPDGLGATGTYEVAQPVVVYLVVTKPTDLETGLPHIGASDFECQLNFNPYGTLFAVQVDFPSQNISYGDLNGIGEGHMEFIIDAYSGYPVIDESVVLVRIVFVQVVAEVIEVTLGPINISRSPTVPGQMVYRSGNGHLEIMHPVSGSMDAPVFIFNGAAVAVDQESFGSVKASYR